MNRSIFSPLCPPKLITQKTEPPKYKRQSFLNEYNMNSTNAKSMLQTAFGPPSHGGQMSGKDQTRVQVMAEKLAAINHKVWLKDRRIEMKQKGEPLPRVKTEKGKTFDIAVEWSQLNPIWKELQTKDAQEYITGLFPLYKKFMDEASSTVHDIWMKNNKWAEEDNPQLFVEFSALPDTEKKKDLDVTRNLFTIFYEDLVQQLDIPEA
jgi:hypothetical protein